MKKETIKTILIWALVPTAIVVAGYGVRYAVKFYNYKKNAATKEQFSEIVNSFNKNGYDVFENISQDLYRAYMKNFIKNISKGESYVVNKLVSVKKESDMSEDEKLILSEFLKKIKSEKTII